MGRMGVVSLFLDTIGARDASAVFLRVMECVLAKGVLEAVEANRFMFNVRLRVTD